MRRGWFGSYATGVIPNESGAVAARPEQTSLLAQAETRVAIVDMDRRVRLALAEVLAAAGLTVIGTAAEPDAAWEVLANGAEILVLDPRLPELTDGLALIDRVNRQWPSVRVVVMGWADAGETPFRGSDATYVTKSTSPDEFVAATLAACGC
jgi:DNA-binding NarL/FixJ family response regulator